MQLKLSEEFIPTVFGIAGLILKYLKKTKLCHNIYLMLIGSFERLAISQCGQWFVNHF